MRNLWAFVAMAVLLGAPAAHAQFANRSLGLQIGALNLQGTRAGIHDLAIPIDLVGSLYLDNHFELTAQAGALLYKLPVGEAPRHAAFDAALGLRYLFMEETFRPYVGLGLTPLWFVGGTNDFETITGVGSNPNLFYLGAYASAGAEVFVESTVSIGLKVQGNAYVDLNFTTAYAYGAYLYGAAYF